MVSGQFNLMQFSCDAYAQNGWYMVPITPGSKGPQTTGWNQKENCIGKDQLVPQGHGIGLAHAYSNTMAFDIDDWEQTKIFLAVQGIDLDSLYDNPNTVTIESGVNGHGKLLFSLPPWLQLPTKRITFKDLHRVTRTLCEFRCTTSDGTTVQDVLPPTIHPITNQPYQWGGRGHWGNLPPVPPELYAIWFNLVQQDNPPTQPGATRQPAHTTSWDKILNAINYIDPSIGRDDWLKVGMALHQHGCDVGQLDMAFIAWDNWSKGSRKKYGGQREMFSIWRSFKPGGGVNLATLFQVAKQYGYVISEKDITPVDVEALFQGTNLIGDVLEDVRSIPVPHINLNLFPRPLADRVRELSDEVGCDPIISLFAGLATICAAVDARTKLIVSTDTYSDYHIPPIMWFLVVGPPGDKKSPGSKPMRQMLDKLEMDDHPLHKLRMREWSAKHASHAAQLVAYHKAATQVEAAIGSKDGLAVPENLPAVHDCPPPPVELRFIVTDTTSQKLARMVADRPRGLCCWMDEMHGWLKRVSNPTGGEDVSMWLEAHAGGPYRVDRVGSADSTGNPSTYVQNLAVSVYANVQNEILGRMGETLTDNGLMQRFIPGVLTGEFDRLPQRNGHDDTLRDAWDNLVKIVYSLPTQQYLMSQAAMVELERFREWHHGLKIDARTSRVNVNFQTAFAKIEGQLLRLTLILHLIKDPYRSTVQAETVQAAISITKEYIIPAIRYLYHDVIASTREQVVLEKVIRDFVIKYSVKMYISEKEIKKACQHVLNRFPVYQQKKLLTDGIELFADKRWLVPMSTAETDKGVTLYAINPRLQHVYRADRDRLTGASQNIETNGIV